MSKHFGKLPHKHDDRTLPFGAFAGGLPAPPPSLSNLDRVAAKLGPIPPAKLFPMDGNDVEGCCTIAGVAHRTTVANGIVGKKKIPTRALVHKAYRHLSGGQDTGLNMLDVLKWLRTTGFDGETILGFAKINPKNHVHVKQAIKYFGGAYTGFQVQENCIRDFDNRVPWTPGKLTEDGHAVETVDYTPELVKVLTWADVQAGTWAWWDECVDEAWAVIPHEAADPNFVPGWLTNDFLKALKAVTN